MSKEIATRLIKNAVFNFLRYFITVPVTLLLMPFVVRNIGTQDFGIWALVGVISSYAQLSDFGISESLIKFIAEHKARNDIFRLNQLVNTAMVIYVVIGIVGSSIFVLMIPYIVVDILHIPSNMIEVSEKVFVIAILLFFINMVAGIFSSIIIGFQEMGYSNIISLVSTILSAIGTVWFIKSGYGLVGLVYNNAIVTVAVIAMNIVVVRRLFSEMECKPFRYFNANVLRDIFNFSWKIHLTTITQLMIFQIDRILLSRYIGLSAVSNYEIANKLVSQARSLVATVFSPIAPASSAINATRDTETIAQLYSRSFKYMVILAVPASFLIIALSKPFVLTWMGTGYDSSIFTIRILMFASMVNLLTGPGGWIMVGINKPHVGMISSIAAGITNVLLCFILVALLGYNGIVIGISISLVSSALLFFWLFHRNIAGVDTRLYSAILGRPLIVSVLLSLLILALDYFAGIHGYIALTAVSVLYFLGFGVCINNKKYLDDFDRSVIARLNPLRVAGFRCS